MPGHRLLETRAKCWTSGREGPISLALSFQRCFRTALLGAPVPQHIPLPVEAGDKHGPAMPFAAWLVRGDTGRLVPSGGGVAQGFGEATLAELFGASEKLKRIVDVERGEQEFHRPIVLIAQRQGVGPHGGSLASAARQNRAGIAI
jgi:hypothetical protein